MLGNERERLQGEVSKLVFVLQELNYPSRSLGPLQDNLLPPNKFELATVTLLALIRWLETDALSIYTSFLREYIIDPSLAPDQTSVYLMYNTVIDLLHYEPKLSAEAFLDRICGSITNELKDLHYYRVRTVRIFAKLLHDLQLRWIRHSSEQMRATDGFIVLLPPTLRPQLPYVAQRWTSHPALVMHPAENAGYRGLVSETPSDVTRIHRAPVPRYSQQITRLVDNTRHAVAAQLHSLPRDTAVSLDDLPGDIQRRIRGQFPDLRKKSKGTKAKLKTCKRRSRRHKHAPSGSSSSYDYSSEEAYISDYYSDYYSEDDEYLANEERNPSRSRSGPRTKEKSKQSIRSRSRPNSRRSQASRGHRKRSHDERASSRSGSRGVRSASKSRRIEAEPASQHQPNLTITSIPIAKSSQHSQSESTTGRPSSAALQEGDLTDRELLLQLGRATAKKYVTSASDFYGATHQSEGFLQQTSEFPASNSDPSMILNTMAPRYSQKDESILADACNANMDLQVNQLNAVPVQSRVYSKTAPTTMAQSSLSTGPITLPAVPMTSSYPPSCNAYTEPTFNVQNAGPATPLYNGHYQTLSKATSAHPLELSTSNVPIYHFPDDGVYVPGYPYVNPTEFSRSSSLPRTQEIPAKLHRDPPMSTPLTPYATAQRYVEKPPILSEGVNLRPLLEQNPDPIMEQMIQAEIRRAESDPRVIEEVQKLIQEDEFRRSMTTGSITLPPASTSGSIAPSIHYMTPAAPTSVQVPVQMPTTSYLGSTQIGRIDSNTNELLPAPSTTNSNAAVSVHEKTTSLPPPTTTNSIVSSMPSKTITGTTTGSMDDYTNIVNRALQSTPSAAPPRPASAISGSYASQTFYDNLTSYSGKELSSSFRDRISRLARESSSTPETASISGRDIPASRSAASASKKILVANHLPESTSLTPQEITNLVTKRSNSALKNTTANAVPLMVNRHGQVQVNPDVVFPEIPASERQKPEYKAAIEAEALRQTHSYVPDTSKYHSVGDLTEEDLKKSGIAYIRESTTTSGSSSIPECVIGHLVDGSRSSLSTMRPQSSMEAPGVMLQGAQSTQSAVIRESAYASPQELGPMSQPSHYNAVTNSAVSRSPYTHSVKPANSISVSGNMQSAIAAITDRVEHVQSELAAASSAISYSHHSASTAMGVPSMRQPQDLSRMSTGTRGDSVLSSMNTMSTKSVRFAGQDATDSHDLSMRSSEHEDLLNNESSSSVVYSKHSGSTNQKASTHDSVQLSTPSAHTSAAMKTSTSNLPPASSTSQNYDVESKRSLIESAKSLSRTANALQKLQDSDKLNPASITSSPKEYMDYQIKSTSDTTKQPSLQQSRITTTSTGGSLPLPESTSLVSDHINSTIVTTGTSGSTLLPPSSTTNTGVTGSSTRPTLYMPNLGQSTEMISSAGNPNPALNNSTLLLSEGTGNSIRYRDSYDTAIAHAEPKYSFPQYVSAAAPPSTIPLVADRIAAAVDNKSDSGSRPSTIPSSTVGSGTSRGSTGSGSGASTNTIKHLSDATSENANGLGTLSVNAYRPSIDSQPSNGLDASRVPLTGSRLRELKAQGENLLRAANEIETIFAPPNLNQPSSTGTTAIGPGSLGSTNISNTTYST